MDEVPTNPHVRLPEDVFRDFRARRAGIVNALTTDVEKFYKLCDPEKENLCLYGLPNETWGVTLPAEEVPSELPEPVLGINFARDGITQKEWLSLVAAHSDSWLLAVAFYYGTRFRFDKEASHLSIPIQIASQQSIPHQSTRNRSVKKTKAMRMRITCAVFVKGAMQMVNSGLVAICEKWFHGECVRITAAKAEYIKQYKCPSCSTKRSRE
ncbi:hypothetical protein PR202_ga20204 [Eleusine coracana subsp. coracana]|uniref:PHD finger protein ALFIN-LIKE n=1 Tax=Eleusine coracana subsp. coracana TaxID=191504 RepID=A0AAV5CW49_ELECO|nr:hypothetical protein PR202_ga20204 [Eleusine coracana subsp. coracana]